MEVCVRRELLAARMNGHNPVCARRVLPITPGSTGRAFPHFSLQVTVQGERWGYGLPVPFLGRGN